MAGRPGFVESLAAGPQPIKAGPARPVSNTDCLGKQCGGETTAWVGGSYGEMMLER